MLLAPTCVLRGMKVDSAYSIENLCAISYQAANISWDKLQRLCALDDAYMAERGYSYFLDRQPSGKSTSSLSHLLEII